MKTLGLLGGMSWESTTAYYQRLNRLARDRLGGQHSAKLLIWSADFAPIAAMQAADDWAGATAVLVDAARRLEVAGAEALLICANTMHLMAAEVAAAVDIPLLHVADATAARLTAHSAKRPLLLATRFTMERPFYRERLASQGVEAVIPPAADRARLHAIIFDELVQGRFEPASRAAVADIAARAIAQDGADSVVLGCTEFGLLMEPADFGAPVFDTTEIHAQAAMDFALGPLLPEGEEGAHALA
jgi:aspartate racemase